MSLLISSECSDRLRDLLDADDLVSTRLPRRFRRSFVHSSGRQVGDIAIRGNFLRRRVVRGQLGIDQYVWRDGVWEFADTLFIDIPSKHFCHVVPDSPRGCRAGSLGTIVRYWTQGTYKTEFDSDENFLLVLTSMRFDFI